MKNSAKIVGFNSDERIITFATMVGEVEVEHQISIDNFDTREKVQAEIDRVLAQVAQEIGVHAARAEKIVPNDIKAMVEEAGVQDAAVIEVQPAPVEEKAVTPN